MGETAGCISRRAHSGPFGGARRTRTDLVRHRCRSRCRRYRGGTTRGHLLVTAPRRLPVALPWKAAYVREQIHFRTSAAHHQRKEGAGPIGKQVRPAGAGPHQPRRQRPWLGWADAVRFQNLHPGGRGADDASYGYGELTHRAGCASRKPALPIAVNGPGHRACAVLLAAPGGELPRAYWPTRPGSTHRAPRHRRRRAFLARLEPRTRHVINRPSRSGTGMPVMKTAWRDRFR